MRELRKTLVKLPALRAGALLLVGAAAVEAQTPKPPQPLTLVRESTIPTPASVLGFEPGTDRKLPTWKQVTDYFTALDKASPRVTVRTLGKTTLGRPFLVAFISDSATLANLERYRQIQRKLADPRLPGAGRARPADRRGEERHPHHLEHPLHRGRRVPHSARAGRPAGARGDTPEARQILANTIVMLVPSQNPGRRRHRGRLVPLHARHARPRAAGRRRSITTTPATTTTATGTPSRRSRPATPSTRCTRRGIRRSSTTSTSRARTRGRIFIPPYMDPVEPNIDPDPDRRHQLARHGDGWRMICRGQDRRRDQRVLRPVVAGAAVLAQPSRRPHPHRDRQRPAGDAGRPSVRVAGHCARLRCARRRRWNFPALWPGGTWGIGNIVDYQTSASWALLAEAARDRAAWLESYAALGDRALAADHPWRPRGRGRRRYVIPKAQARHAGAAATASGRCSTARSRSASPRAPVTVGRQVVPGGQLRGARCASRSAATPTRCSSGSGIPISASIPAGRPNGPTMSPPTRCRCSSASTSRRSWAMRPRPARSLGQSRSRSSPRR